MIENRIEAAEQRRQEAEAKLLRLDGSKYFGDEEHKERVAEHRGGRGVPT